MSVSRIDTNNYHILIVQYTVSLYHLMLFHETSTEIFTTRKCHKNCNSTYQSRNRQLN